MGILCEINDGIAEVVMDNPPVNALTVQGWLDLANAVNAAGDNPATRVVILAAEGKGFNAGVDIKEMQRSDGFDALVGANKGCYAAFKAVYECKVPVIAAVNGFCVGGGIGLVGNADGGGKVTAYRPVKAGGCTVWRDRRAHVEGRCPFLKSLPHVFNIPIAETGFGKPAPAHDQAGIKFAGLVAHSPAARGCPEFSGFANSIPSLRRKATRETQASSEPGPLPAHSGRLPSSSRKGTEIAPSSIASPLEPS